MNTFPRMRKSLLAASASLKYRITAGALAALVLGIVLTTLVLVRQTERDTLAAARDRELHEASRDAAALSRRIIELQQALKIGAERFNAGRIGDQRAVDDFLHSLPILRTMFSSVFVVDASGRMRALIDANGLQHPTLDLRDRPYFQQALNEMRPIISRAVPSRRHGEPIVIFAQPLVDRNGVQGVLAGSLNLGQRNLLVDLVDRGDETDGALSVITDAQGRILAHPDPALVLSPLSVEPRLATAAQRWQGGGNPVEPSGLTIVGATGLVTAGGVPGPDWVIWRAVDDQQLFAALHAARRAALTWAAVLIVLCSALMLLGLRWLLRPLRQVQERARRMFEDKLDPHEGWPQVGGEIGSLAAVLRHIGVERARLEASNSHLLQQLSSVMSNAPVGLAFTRDRRFELVSTEFCRLLGRSEADLLGQPAVSIYDSQADYDALAPAVAAAFANGEAYVGDVRMRRADGSRFWSHLRGRPVDAANSRAGTIWTITDITDEVVARNELEWAANHDALTGLANRQALENRLQNAFDAQPQSLPASLLMIDLDHFKQINDSAGHAAGDTVLCAVASTLLARLRSRDLAARAGGDEFVVLLDHCAEDAALKLAAELCAAIASITLPFEQQALRFGASIGVAELSPGHADVDAWMMAADRACYDAKEAGRNRATAWSRRAALRIVAA
ncbi:diguanylate cyclase domain-containing protein [Piscinibacter sakaiensis]|uniref:diguanylate cyclase domain-containing protein n=1 Tax=Piscinibacter sakaiensis TaxID=1547922 RepID=UPI003AB0C144